MAKANKKFEHQNVKHQYSVDFNASNCNAWLLEMVHPDLFATKNLVYDPSNFKCSKPQIAAYGACSFTINNYFIEFRVAKITPTKVGQFVTLWKRIDNGPIQPYDVFDKIDFFIVSTRQVNNFGQFVFPKSVLYEQNIIAKNGQGGKRAMRVYPPWVKTTSVQAQKTQQWQLAYFLKIEQNGSIDFIRVKMLYCQK